VELQEMTWAKQNLKNKESLKAGHNNKRKYMGEKHTFKSTAIIL